MIRQIIQIDRERCDGCGLCVDACHEGAIAMINGKAKLVREDYCDGLGDCLPACPAGAISFVTREALPFSEEANDVPMMTQKCDCIDVVKKTMGERARWPIQMKLLSPDAAFLKGADLLVAADCTAFVHADFHKNFIKGRVVLVGCPKLDREDYGQRLTAIIDRNDVRSITLVRMDIPCCTELSRMVKEALAMSKKKVPLEIAVLSTDGKIAG
ncbi:MAG: 4Fe-4S binding protein [Methanomassiliicoccaceae archaeon]|jgi:NAD-dependent dihydropyrimidine dehydrogenase PreA subunit|nr:4Fe-4S binding protein [Methanomassiliicoccaceae archaeon]